MTAAKRKKEKLHQKTFKVQRGSSNGSEVVAD